jgi:hypothetical protein
VDFVCECGDGKCHDKLRTTTEAYEKVRADPLCFLVAPGHVAEDVEEVVERFDAYWVVKKIGETTRIAASTDPRS